ncbi:MAG: sugar-binding protein, partial [Bacteroidota bacterium]
TNGGTGNATVSFTVTKNNSLPYPRSAKARISSGGKIIEISLVQEGKPAQVKFSPGAFVVNAFQEAAWNGVPWNNIRRKVKGNTPDQQDRVRFAYNRNSLFVLVQVFDSTPLPGDSLRVGLDIGNDKEVAVRDEDLFFILDRSGNVYSDNATTVSRITAAARQVSNGYFYEFSVDWDDLGVIPFAGTGIGVDFKVSDDQTGTAATTEHFSQFFADSDLLTNVPLNWGNAELVGSDIPWFEDFQFDTGVTQDDGPTAWTIDAANIDPTGIFAVERSSRGTRFEARKLKAEAAWLSETIDISTSDFVKVGLDVFEVGANAGNYLRVYAKVDGGPEELILALEGDTPEDETRTRLQTNGISGQDLQLVVRAFNDNGGTAYYFENVLVDFGDATNCPAPTTPTVDAVNQTSVDLSWTADLSGLALFEVGYRVAGTTNYTVVTVTNDDQLTISGLADNTDYEWRVRRDCAGENSSWVDGPDFSTVAPLNRQDLYYENFDLAGCTPTNVPVPSYPCYRE